MYVDGTHKRVIVTAVLSERCLIVKIQIGPAVSEEAGSQLSPVCGRQSVPGETVLGGSVNFVG